MLLNLCCYFPAENHSFIEIEVDSGSRLKLLANKIVAELRSEGLADVKVRDLLLYKTDLSLDPEEDLQTRALQWIHQQPPNSELKQSNTLSMIFPNGPHPAEELKLDLIVANQEVLEMSEILDDPDKEYNKKIKDALHKRINNLSPGPSPSEIVHSPKMLEDAFGGKNPHIHIGRRGGAPAVIFNPVLAKFKQRLEHLEQVQVSAMHVDRAAQYLREAVKFHADDKSRENAMRDVIDSAIGQPNWRTCIDLAASQIVPGACWWHEMFLTVVLELTNTLGLSGDALYRAVLDYSEIISRDQYKRFREYCNFPVVLVGITENRLEISVAVCVGSIYVTKLLSLDLCVGFHVSDDMVHLARVFRALSLCREDLNDYYRVVSTLASPRLSCLFPSPTPLDPDKRLPKLTYKHFLSRTGEPTPDLMDLTEATTAMYTATLDDIYQEANQEANLEVIVKFTARYNEAAHRLLAEARLAPRLHFCGRVVGDLFMIVMDRVDGMSVWQLQQNKTPIPAIVVTKVEEALHLLHDSDIVFGDLRSNNILYGPEDHVVLVDFDWAGKDQEARYPVTLNVQEEWWAEGVSAYSIMETKHDLWELKRLKDMCIKS